MKKFVLTESDITKIVKKSIERKLNEDKFSVEPDVPRQPRERDIDNLFGKYTYHVPDDVIRYMRKNPALIIKRLVDIYGEDKVKQYVDNAVKPDEMKKRLDSPSLRDGLDEDHSGDPNDKYVVKKNGDKWCVWEGNVKVETFDSEEEAQEYADKENKEQSLNEMMKRILSKI
jgi:hypothetical protein